MWFTLLTALGAVQYDEQIKALTEAGITSVAYDLLGCGAPLLLLTRHLLLLLEIQHNACLRADALLTVLRILSGVCSHQSTVASCHCALTHHSLTHGRAALDTGDSEKPWPGSKAELWATYTPDAAFQDLIAVEAQCTQVIPAVLSWL